MLTESNKSKIEQVLNKLYIREGESWTAYDDLMELVDYLDDSQLYREVSVSDKTVNCGIPHSGSCFIEELMDASHLISVDFQDTEILGDKHRYILQSYIALEGAGVFVVS